MDTVSTRPAGPDAELTQYCGHCGEPDGNLPCGAAGTGTPATAAAGPTSDAHQACRQRLAMEPPRYCPQCRRRMKVQVTPLGWTAECSRHGMLAS